MHTEELRPSADFHAAAADTETARAAKNFFPRYRLPLLCLLLFCEAAAIALFVHPRSAHYTEALSYVTQLGVAERYLIYFFTALILALIAHLPHLWRSLAAANAHGAEYKRVVAHLLCYGALWLTIGALVPNDMIALHLPVRGHEALWSALLLGGIAASACSALPVLAPWSWWMNTIKQEKAAILLALGFTAGIYFITGIFQQTWDDFLSVPTIAVAQFLLDTLHGNVIVHPDTKELGIGNFVVLISSTCSGYEGMGMIVSFLAWYSLTFKQELKYPHALLLYPIALTAMWLLNCVRIAALIWIGYAISPEIAMQGFHSNAGWIYFLCMSVGLILVARRIPFFSGKAHGTVIGIDDLNVLLLPELILLIASLVTSAMSGDFVWLYPLRIAAAGVALAYFWKRFELGRLTVSMMPVLIGAAVFFLWVALVPDSIEVDRRFASSLASAPGLAAAGWIAVRALGATLVIPLAEELAFRGYLIKLLSPQPERGDNSYAHAWMPLLVSSVLFGALHSQWLAGTLAGVGYGIARYRRGKVWDAVLAHMVTNGLLAVYVLLTHRWSYW
jgi:exosortase E/protease (VPEID-CTERM system)